MGQQVVKVSSKTDAKIASKNIACEEARVPVSSPSWCQEGARERYTSALGRMRFGRKEEKKKGRKEDGKKEGRKVSRKAGRVYTLVLVGRWNFTKVQSFSSVAWRFI